jgi:hypothetical protein
LDSSSELSELGPYPEGGIRVSYLAVCPPRRRQLNINSVSPASDIPPLQAEEECIGGIGNLQTRFWPRTLRAFPRKLPYPRKMVGRMRVQPLIANKRGRLCTSPCRGDKKNSISAELIIIRNKQVNMNGTKDNRDGGQLPSFFQSALEGEHE